MKQRGAFQHSSFLHGARISAAGLIKIKAGQLQSMSLSGVFSSSSTIDVLTLHNTPVKVLERLLAWLTAFVVFQRMEINPIC